MCVCTIIYAIYVYTNGRLSQFLLASSRHSKVPDSSCHASASLVRRRRLSSFAPFGAEGSHKAGRAPDLWCCRSRNLRLDDWILKIDSPGLATGL